MSATDFSAPQAHQHRARKPPAHAIYVPTGEPCSAGVPRPLHPLRSRGGAQCRFSGDFAEALYRTRTDDPFLTMEGPGAWDATRCYPMATKGLQSDAIPWHIM
jgi:hypothetical protein